MKKESVRGVFLIGTILIVGLVLVVIFLPEQQPAPKQSGQVTKTQPVDTSGKSDNPVVQRGLDTAAEVRAGKKPQPIYNNESSSGSGHAAGYNWGEQHDICDTEYDNGNSESFNEGVREYAEENCN